MQLPYKGTEPVDGVMEVETAAAEVLVDDVRVVGVTTAGVVLVCVCADDVEAGVGVGVEVGVKVEVGIKVKVDVEVGVALDVLEGTLTTSELP